MSKDKLISLSKESAKKGTWLKGALERRKNRKWLNYSGNIARRILAKIENDNNLSQTELAKLLDVSRQQISKIVKGHENMTLETIAKLSEALGVELISFPEYKYSTVEYSQVESSWVEVDTFIPNDMFQNPSFNMPDVFIKWGDLNENKIINAQFENSIDSVEAKMDDPSHKYLKVA